MAKSKQIETKSWPWWLVFAVPAAVLLLLAVSYLPFISDDAFISLRYAKRLLAGDGLTWTDGERVEGYSNLLWILASAALGLTGLDLIVAARVLGFAGSLAAIAALVRAHAPRIAGTAPPLLGGLMLAVSGTLAVWAVGGLEQPLLAALLAWAVAALYPLLDDDAARSPWPAALLLASVCLTRPDGVLFTAGLALGFVAARGGGAGTFALTTRLVGPSIVAIALQTGFRLAYYGAWLPNTAGAKLSLGTRRLAEGGAYVGLGALWAAGLVLPALLLALVARRAPPTARRLRLLLPSIVLWSGYVIVVGGDLFPARRHLAPLVVLLAFVLASALEGLRKLDVPWLRRATAAAGLGLVAFGAMQHFDPENRRARLERWEWDGATIGNVLRRGFPDRPLLAVDPAGTVPYFSELPSIDMLGLNDRYLATHRPDDFGTGHLGHELGDGAYVLDREPDLVLFCGPGGDRRRRDAAGVAQPEPCFRSGREMVADPRFEERYTAVTFQGTGKRDGSGEPYVFRSQIWVRREGGRIGIRRDGAGVVVPSYLMTRIGEPVAKLDGPGRFVVTVGGQAAAGIDRVPLAAGNWNLRVEAEGPPLRTMVRMSDSEEMLGGDYNGANFTIRGEPGSEWPVDVLTLPSTPDGEALVARLVFTPLD